MLFAFDYVFFGRKYIYILTYANFRRKSSRSRRGGVPLPKPQQRRHGRQKTGDHTQKIHPRNIKWTHIGKNCKFAEEIIITSKEVIMKEDPLKRLDRLEEEKKSKTPRQLTIILAVIAAVLALALGFIYYDKSRLVSDLRLEKDELTMQIEALQKDYSSLSSDYESINHQLDSSREEVAQLVARIKKTEATNRAKIRQYQKELGTLRTIMRSYIVQIDSLNTVNKKLTVEVAQARKDAAESRKANQELTNKVSNLSDQVARGSQIKARSIVLEAQNHSGKKTDRSSRVVRFATNLTLLENELTPRGPLRIYVVLKDRDGDIITNGDSVTLELNGTPMVTSASREIDYEGSEVEMTVFINDVKCSKGVYHVDVYSEKGLIGSAETYLR